MTGTAREGSGVCAAGNGPARLGREDPGRREPGPLKCRSRQVAGEREGGAARPRRAGCWCGWNMGGSGAGIWQPRSDPLRVCGGCGGCVARGEDGRVRRHLRRARSLRAVVPALRRDEARGSCLRGGRCKASKRDFIEHSCHEYSLSIHATSIHMLIK